jgi:hypothetical protein
VASQRRAQRIINAAALLITKVTHAQVPVTLQTTVSSLVAEAEGGGGMDAGAVRRRL